MNIRRSGDHVESAAFEIALGCAAGKAMTGKFDPAAHASLDLPDGRALEFEIRRSARTRSVYLKMSPREGLVVTAPRRLGRAGLLRIVASKAAWIANRLSEFEAVRHLVAHDSVRPLGFDLPALAESWRVEYTTVRRPGVRARIDRPGLIVVSGAVDDVEACQGAVRRWLARHATNALPPWFSSLAQQAGLRYVNLSIRSQRARWGSCTVGGRISLNCKLLFLPRELVSYVMMHELCHLLEANHSHRFWAHVRRLEPATDRLRRSMRDAWKWVPGWAL
jgi:predicted metal-dependent hydrolase